MKYRQEVTVGIINGIRINKLSGIIHLYPTQAEGIKKAADAFNQTNLKLLSIQFYSLLSKASFKVCQAKVTHLTRIGNLETLCKILSFSKGA